MHPSSTPVKGDYLHSDPPSTHVPFPLCFVQTKPGSAPLRYTYAAEGFSPDITGLRPACERRRPETYRIWVSSSSSLLTYVVLGRNGGHVIHVGEMVLDRFGKQHRWDEDPIIAVNDVRVSNVRVYTRNCNWLIDIIPIVYLLYSKVEYIGRSQLGEQGGAISQAYCYE